MNLGVGLLSAQRPPGDDRSAAELYEDQLAVGEAADRAGLDSVWTSEHHFTDDGYLSGTVPTLAALAARTDDVEIASGVALAPLYDSVRLAEDAATVDAFADGRLTLGLSIGYLDEEFDNFGVPKAERAPRTEEAVEVLRNAWTPGELGFDPEYHPASPDVRVTPKPDDPPEIVLGGLARPAVRRAARVADGWCANEMLSVEGVRKRKEDAEQVREGEGVDGAFTTYVIQYGFVGDSYEQAWETIRGGYFYQQRKYQEWAGGASIDELPEERREQLEEAALVGTPEDVAADLREYRDTLGDDVHFVFRTYYPGVDRDAMTECIERLGDEVAPRV